jgi:hypothetical protein
MKLIFTDLRAAGTKERMYRKAFANRTRTIVFEQEEMSQSGRQNLTADDTDQTNFH